MNKKLKLNTPGLFRITVVFIAVIIQLIIIAALVLLLKKHAKDSFLEAIKMCQNYYKFKLIAAEVRDNHFHLLIRTLKDEGTVDRIMQYIKARTAEKYNKAAKRKGPFWNERYKSAIIDESVKPRRYISQLS